ncbi:hypothetical protein RRG08_014937 [Elysia crispata]|uniref:Uncharacterized protein n=1 Tax=Elysia crispata TaxID=231223 RepID=A0AAE1E7J5_9GAST|nr:hypothetical protein RRG08_014937 [Elysia crispata]
MKRSLQNFTNDSAALEPLSSGLKSRGLSEISTAYICVMMSNVQQANRSHPQGTRSQLWHQSRLSFTTPEGMFHL